MNYLLFQIQKMHIKKKKKIFFQFICWLVCYQVEHSEVQLAVQLLEVLVSKISLKALVYLDLL